MVDNSVTQKTTPQELKNRIQRFYEFLNKRLNASIYAEYAMFMNWGYEPNESPSCAKVKLPANYLNKRSTQLVLELVGDCDLTGAKVLDVGCGRGGTLYTLNQFYAHKELSGLDITAANIEYCRKNVPGDRIHFYQGDAENLPFANCEFNVVTNVESSHGYPDRQQFYREVYRVLKPGGYFLYTDVFLNQELNNWINIIQEIGFSLEIDRDITSNVLLSRQKEAEYQIEAFAAEEEEESVENTEQIEDIKTYHHVMALPDSHLYESMEKREYVYRIYRFKKCGDVDKLGLHQGKREPSLSQQGTLRSQKQKEAIRRITFKNNNSNE